MNNVSLLYSFDNGVTWIFAGLFSYNQAWDAQRAIQNANFGKNIQFQQKWV